MREAGLATALPGAVLTADVMTLEPEPSRGPAGLLNEDALLTMIDTVYGRVRGSLAERRFPLLYGADCAVLLGAVPALRDEAGAAGLLFLDAHEDATTMAASPDGEAANMEIALLLGLAGADAPAALRRHLPAIDRRARMLGQRDEAYRDALAVPSLADRVRLHPADRCTDGSVSWPPAPQSTRAGRRRGGRTSISTCSVVASSPPATRQATRPCPVA